MELGLRERAQGQVHRPRVHGGELGGWAAPSRRSSQRAWKAEESLPHDAASEPGLLTPAPAAR